MDKDSVVRKFRTTADDGKTYNVTYYNLDMIISLGYRIKSVNISEHIKHIFEEGELDKDSVVRKFRTTADDGKTYNVTYYNLDMIISLGYRIKSVNRKLLTGAGSVSHKQALEKAKSEYRKYQEITLTPVEKAYLESIKEVSKEVKRR